MIELTEEDLKSMVLSTQPYYNLFDNDLIKSLGSYTGGFVDKWQWDRSALDKLSAESLYTVYIMCKNSWK